MGQFAKFVWTVVEKCRHAHHVRRSDVFTLGDLPNGKAALDVDGALHLDGKVSVDVIWTPASAAYATQVANVYGDPKKNQGTNPRGTKYPAKVYAFISTQLRSGNVWELYEMPILQAAGVNIEVVTVQAPSQNGP